MSVAETLSDRMKEYEKVTEARLIKKQPVIIRLDGKAFHTFTQGIDKPFDEDLADAFEFTCVKLKEKVQGAKLIYTQSDEISILLTDWEKTTTDCWFDYRIQKVDFYIYFFMLIIYLFYLIIYSSFFTNFFCSFWSFNSHCSNFLYVSSITWS